MVQLLPGTVEANLAMHRADLVVCVGARFDDRVTGKLDEFCPGSSVKLSIGTVKGGDTDPRCGCLRLLPPAVEVLVSACV